MAALVATVLLSALPAPVALAQAQPDASASRAQAREILQERRFRGSEVPRPFRGLLRWLGDRLQPITDFIDDIAVDMPGGRPLFFVILGVLVLLASGAARTRVDPPPRRRRGTGRPRPQP